MPLYTSEDMRISRAVAAPDLDRRAAYNAEQARKSLEQREAESEEFFRQDAIRHEHRVRGRAAYYSGRPAPKRRRDFADPPPPNRQYVTMATTAFRDMRLSKTEQAALAILTARAGKEGHVDITHGQFAKAIGRSRSTSKRIFKTLTDKPAGTDYITVEILRYANGRARCMRVRPTDKAWPFWHDHRQDPGEPGGGSISAPPITSILKEESMEENPLSGMDPEVVRLYREIVDNIPMTDDLVEKMGVTREKVVDHLVELIVKGHLAVSEDLKTGIFSLVPTKKAAEVVPANNPAFKRRRRAFRP